MIRSPCRNGFTRPSTSKASLVKLKISEFCIIRLQYYLGWFTHKIPYLDLNLWPGQNWNVKGIGLTRPLTRKASRVNIGTVYHVYLFPGKLIMYKNTYIQEYHIHYAWFHMIEWRALCFCAVIFFQLAAMTIDGYCFSFKSYNQLFFFNSCLSNNKE